MKSSLLQSSKKSSIDRKSKSSSSPTAQLNDNRKNTQNQQHLINLANTGKTAVQLKAFSHLFNGNAILQKMSIEEEEPLQGKFDNIQKQGLEEEELMQGKFKTIQKMDIEEEEPLQGKFETIQKQGLEEEELMQGKFKTIQKQENNTGLPDNLKSGIENLSGYSMDDVKVHYNSDKPATLQAHAYAQGTDIHIASGQEKHLPHEAWHVVQQKQGRVKPTIQLQGKVNVNDDAGLEQEADLMGEKALKMQIFQSSNENSIQRRAINKFQKTPSKISTDEIVQRLKVDGTDWSKVITITASTDGQGGVLFMSDSSGKTLVVKPGVPADEEMAANHAHSAIEGHNKMGQWKVQALESRIAVANDVAGIRVAKQRVELNNGALDARATGLINTVAAGTTLIQKSAERGSGSFKDKMLDQSPNGHIEQGEGRTFSDKDKVRKSSPLKPIMKDKSGYVRSLGRLAAADLLLGNFDRLADTANLENMLLNNKKKAIHPIDNTGGTAVSRLMTGGGGPVSIAGWTNHRLVAFFIARNYAAIAAEMWSEQVNSQAFLTIIQEMLHGFEGVVPNRQYTVQPNELADVTTKLTNHIDHIRAEYAIGLQEGRNQLVSKGAIPVGGEVSVLAQQQYAARLAVI